MTSLGIVDCVSNFLIREPKNLLWKEIDRVRCDSIVATRYTSDKNFLDGRNKQLPLR